MTGQFNKGDTIVVTNDHTAYRTSNSGPSREFKEGEVFVVSSVRSTNYVTVKAEGHRYTWSSETGEYSYNLHADNFEHTDPSRAPRRIGQKPEGDHLDVDDPRIQWIFEDAARVAKKANHCAEYDRLCEEVGIPGRVRSHKVTIDINGIKVSASIDARSKSEAEKIFAHKVKANA